MAETATGGLGSREPGPAFAGCAQFTEINGLRRGHLRGNVTRKSLDRKKRVFLE
jgi:hypothetical protein